MVHTKFSSVSRSPSECASASKGKSRMSPKEVAMKKSKLKGKGKKTNFTIQDNVIAPPKVLHFSRKLDVHYISVFTVLYFTGDTICYSC